jgi:2-dehydropantoate 2-reductase
MSQVHWHVFGSGAVGCLLASHLSKQNARFSLILRSNQRLQLLKEKGAIMYEKDGQIERIPVPKYETSDEHTTFTEITSPIQRLLITAKSFDVLPGLIQLSKQGRIDENTRLVFFQNGMGLLETLSEKLKSQTSKMPSIYLQGINTHGAFIRNPFHVVHSSNTGASLTFGRISAEQDAKLEEDLMRIFQPLQANFISNREEFDVLVWRKLLVNVCINGLTSLLRCHNGELLEHEAMIFMICKELSPLYQRQFANAEWTKDTELMNIVKRIIHITSHNKSSMLQDVLGNRQTEVDFMHGFILKKAEAFDLKLPFVKFLYRSISCPR